MNTIPTNEISGPPFPCPECAADGKRKTFEKRPALGTHRMQHGVSGTSTGSKAYRFGKLSYKQATPKKKTYVKRTYNKLGTPRGPYNKTPKHNPLVELLNNPSQFATNLDTMIYGKKTEVENLQFQIQELNQSITFLERFRNVATETRTDIPTQAFQEVA
jgi:hypothetical protein